MQFLLLLAATLSLGAGTLASPAPVPDSIESRAYHWHGCGAGIECHSASDCWASEDCVQTALGSTANIHCGQDSYPTACWADWTD
ncbi:hypothetical protein ABZX51_002945 [Aspergillus tubingensis]